MQVPDAMAKPAQIQSTTPTQQGDSGTVSKAFRVLEAVAVANAPVRFVDLLKTQPFPKATLHRLLRTLVAEGMLEHDPRRQTYHPGLRLVRLAHAAWAQASLAESASDALDNLARQVEETIHLSVLDNAQVLYLDKRLSSHPVTMFSSVGKVGPAYCTGVGKTMLAHLPEDQLSEAISRQSFHRYTSATISGPDELRTELDVIRKQGFGFDKEEHEPGIICVAVPILSRRGNLLGGISITSAVHISSLERLEGKVSVLKNAAEEIARQAEVRMLPGT